MQNNNLGSLVISREEAKDKILMQIEKTQSISERLVKNRSILDRACSDKNKWTKFTRELLLRIFDTSAIADEFDFAGFIRLASFGNQTISDEVEDHKEDIKGLTEYLEGLVERLELYPVKIEGAPLKNETKINPSNKKIFIVHGHDNETKQTVARTMQKGELTPIILHEQPSRNKTVIEKIEAHAEVAFAIVLLTPDDIGHAKDHPEQAAPRARQNVILELGYFMGRLGRDRVAVLYKDVEIPNDISGVVYIPIDPGGAWQYAIGKELRAAGIEFDLNKI